MASRWTLGFTAQCDLQDCNVIWSSQVIVTDRSTLRRKSLNLGVMWFILFIIRVVFTDSTEKYDSRDVERLQQDDALVEGYLTWRLYVVEDALKMIDESLQWRKEFGLNGMNSHWIISAMNIFTPC